jgi:hypothetical protein
VNFLERIVGVSPDGGSGTVELLLLLIPVVIVLFVLVADIRGVIRQRRR